LRQYSHETNHPTERGSYDTGLTIRDHCLGNDFFRGNRSNWNLMESMLLETVVIDVCDIWNMTCRIERFGTHMPDHPGRSSLIMSIQK
jgi:hypothetical protein